MLFVIINDHKINQCDKKLKECKYVLYLLYLLLVTPLHSLEGLHAH